MKREWTFENLGFFEGFLISWKGLLSVVESMDRDELEVEQQQQNECLLDQVRLEKRREDQNLLLRTSDEFGWKGMPRPLKRCHNCRGK